MRFQVLPRQWDELGSVRSVQSVWRWLGHRDLRRPAVFGLLTVALWVAWRAAEMYSVFHASTLAEWRRIPFGGIWNEVLLKEDTSLIAVGCFPLLAATAGALTLVAALPEARAILPRRWLLRVHLILLGAALVALAGTFCVGDWPWGQYLWSPLGLALGLLLVTAAGVGWAEGAGRARGWRARLAHHLPLLHLGAVVLAGWCVYARTLGFVVDVRL
jgi:hypothetical protein